MTNSTNPTNINESIDTPIQTLVKTAHRLHLVRITFNDNPSPVTIDSRLNQWKQKVDSFVFGKGPTQQVRCLVMVGVAKGRFSVYLLVEQPPDFKARRKTADFVHALQARLGQVTRRARLEQFGSPDDLDLAANDRTAVAQDITQRMRTVVDGFIPNYSHL